MLIHLIIPRYKILTSFNRKRIFSNSSFVFLILIISVLIRLTLIELFSIPSDSMENTLLPGDIVLISKLSYGARLPLNPSEVPFVNLFYAKQGGRGKNVDSYRHKFKRLIGLSHIKLNDVIVFNSPVRYEEILIKRCVGLPGDTFSIKNSTVFSNMLQLTQNSNIKHMFHLDYNNIAKVTKLMDSLNIKIYHNKLNPKFSLLVPLTFKQAYLIRKFKCIDSIYFTNGQILRSNLLFPCDTIFPYTLDNFGPIVIPSKGMTIQMNRRNYILYNYIIKNFEHEILEEVDSIYFNESIQISSYTFKNNYYFMLGDNRHSSVDSRYYGFIPDQNIIGKAVLILFSYGPNRIRWARCFSDID